MSRERPILFSAAMIQALLDGRKTQTRRIAKLPCPIPAGDWYADRYNGTQEWGIWQRVDGHDTGRLLSPELLACPYGVPGDRLWVRETWQLLRCSPIPDCDGGGWEFDGEHEGPIPKVKPEPYSGLDLAYAATHDLDETRWRPSIHMPRWASRLSLEITAVRLERLHDITEADAQAEGITAEEYRDAMGSYTGAYSALWERINGADSWNLNPYVWVVEFKTLEASA